MASPLWTPPALQWRPFSKAAYVLLLYFAVGIGARSGAARAGPVIALLVGFFVPFPMHVFARFAPWWRSEQTEWLMGMGLTRNSLAFRYAADLLWWSAVHAAGGALALALSDRHEFFDRLWGDAELNRRFVVGLFLIQLTFRSAIAVMAHLERSTLVPARLKDTFNQSYTSRWAAAGWIALGFLIFFSLFGAPVVLGVLTGSVYWLAVPAALYLRLAHTLASTSEFVRRTTPPTDHLGIPIVTAPLPPPRQYFEGLVADSGAPATLKGLCWNGLTRGVKLISVTFLVPIVAIGIWWLCVRWYDRDVPEKILLATVCLPLVFLLIGGHKLFAWAASEDATEFLFVRGVTLRTMARVRMTTAILITAVILSFLGFWTGQMHKDLWPPLWAAVLYFCAILLLDSNPNLLRWRILGCRHGPELARAMRGMILIVPLVFGLGGSWFKMRGLPWLFVGLAAFVPAFVAWGRAYLPLMLRR